ncbi:hypothetical protein SSABA_v1c02200 [Spiroplasma sabaudiense Ar-1343]|uniref:Transmembrane protein n=1 Tax=Spiroplasma sabaudiense Ar-1343 TaxID=1276257 RepID=W6A9C9_9MOLU|nr:hypothetical protein [Spiroplasma sabaudiense]AHI53632.1 hypothetical protein SSABA_v1c02200 [Spiroplasma sabaudiense Ar-1343]
MNLFASFIPESGILDNNSALVLGVVIVAISAFLLGMFLYYFYKFKKSNLKEFYVNKYLFSTIISLTTLGIIIGSLVIVFFTNARAIFGPDDLKADLANNVIIYAMAFPGLAVVISTFTILLIWTHLFGVGFSENRFEMIGENLPYSKIVAVVDDEEAKKAVIIYRQGRTKFRTLVFKKTSVVGLFVLSNAKLTGHDVILEKVSKVLDDVDAANTQMLANAKPLTEEVKVEVALNQEVSKKAEAEPKPEKKPVSKPKPSVQGETSEKPKPIKKPKPEKNED